MEIWKGKIVFNFRPSQNQSRIVMSKIVYNLNLRLLHTMNVRFSLLNIAQRILGVTLPNFQ